MWCFRGRGKGGAAHSARRPFSGPGREISCFYCSRFRHKFQLPATPPGRGEAGPSVPHSAARHTARPKRSRGPSAPRSAARAHRPAEAKPGGVLRPTRQHGTPPGRSEAGGLLCPARQHGHTARLKRNRGAFCAPLGSTGTPPGQGEAGPPHVVRLRTDTFLPREKCPGCGVRWGWAGRSVLYKAALRGTLRRGGRVSARRPTRRFGRFALKPGKVFAPRRTTRRQRRGRHSRHRTAGRAKGESAALPGRGETLPDGGFLQRGRSPPTPWRAKKVPPRVCGPRGGG